MHALSAWLLESCIIKIDLLISSLSFMLNMCCESLHCILIMGWRWFVKSINDSKNFTNLDLDFGEKSQVDITLFCSTLMLTSTKLLVSCLRASLACGYFLCDIEVFSLQSHIVILKFCCTFTLEVMIFLFLFCIYISIYQFLY